MPPLTERLGVVGTAHSLGDGVGEEALDRGIREARATPGPMAPLIEHASDGLEATVLEEELVHESADSCFVIDNDEVAIPPGVAERCLTAELLAELRAHRNGLLHAIGDLFALPGRHRRDDGEEEPARWGGRVDRFTERDEIRIALVESVREVQKLASVAGETGQFGHDDRLNAARADVTEHGLALRVTPDRLP